jgi:hypothetical protein
MVVAQPWKEGLARESGGASPDVGNSCLSKCRAIKGLQRSTQGAVVIAYGFGISTFLTNTFLHQVHSLRGCRVLFWNLVWMTPTTVVLTWTGLSNPTHILGYLLWWHFLEAILMETSWTHKVNDDCSYSQVGYNFCDWRVAESDSVPAHYFWSLSLTLKGHFNPK